jgi:thioredoxin 1
MKKLLYFTAEWCGPCKMYGPIIAEIAQTYPVTKIDIDASQHEARLYMVKNIPTTILIDENGNEVTRLVGVQSKATLENLLK